MLDQRSSRSSSQERLAIGALEAARRFLSEISAEPTLSNTEGNRSSAINAIDVAADELNEVLCVDVRVSVDLARIFLLDVLSLNPVYFATDVLNHLDVAIRELDNAAAKLARDER